MEDKKVEELVIKDIVDVPIQTSQVQNVRFFYYRKPCGTLVKDIVLTVDGVDYHLYGDMAQKIFKYLNEGSLPMLMKFRDLKDLPHEQRNEILLKALHESDKELMLSAKRSNRGDAFYVLRIATTDFVPIPHSTVIDAIEEALGNAKVCFDKTVQKDRGMYVTYDTNLTDGKTYKYRIWAYNYNDGSHGLRLGTGAFVLVCSNGLIRYTGQESLRIVHKTEIEQVKAKIVDFIDTALHKHLDLETMIEAARQKRINKERTLTLIEKQRFNKDIYSHLANRITDNDIQTLWDLSQLLTETGTHMKDISLNRRIELQRLGGRVLEDSKTYQEIVINA